MRVLVCGGREFHDRTSVYTTLDALHVKSPISLLIHGGARGADRLGWDWARSRHINARGFYADWDYHGKSAGVIRNQEMIDKGKPELVVAFKGGRGTLDMVNRALKAGVKVEFVGWSAG